MAAVGGYVPGANGNSPVKSDPRFRSFCERWVIARAPFFRVGCEGEDTFNAILDAKRAYSLIRRTGQHLDPEDI